MKKKEKEALLLLLAQAVDAREGIDPRSGTRLQDHALRFAEALGLDKEAKAALALGALLHDIGKIQISNEVLLKKSVLDYDDWITLQSHPTLGAALLEERGLYTEVADIVRYHHECFDGTGYPNKIEGDEIPFLARVVKLLDVYCSMTSPRHYRTGHASHKEAVEYLQSERGKHYDPALVDAFIEHKIGRELA